MNRYFTPIKHICIYGTGGVGGYFGGKIAEGIYIKNLSGYSVSFIARGEHLEAINRNGIKVITPRRTITAVPSVATDNINNISSPDLILLCVKSYDLDRAVMSLSARTSSITVVIPLLNGVDVYQRIRTNLNNGIILPACLYLGTHIESPGVINQSGGNGVIIFGPDPRFPRFTAHNVKSVFKDMDIGFEWLPDPMPAIWEKYIFIASFGLVTAATGKSLGEVMANREFKGITAAIMKEIYDIAIKKSIQLPQDIIEKSLAKAGSFPYDARTSYQRDVEKPGGLNEGDLYGGTIIREGTAVGIPTPVTESMYRKITNGSHSIQ
jgi:2-dehydropantoate 2-reductase